MAPAALAVALAWGGAAVQVHANPSGGVAIQGQATMATNGNKLLVTTQNGAGTNHSAINWQSFSIPAGNTTYFQQPSATSTVINRVVTATPSLIFGTLGSNGNVVLVNQSGITVGAGAIVDTAGFTASALRMSDADAMDGRLRFGDDALATGGVSVQGSILARSGDAVLIGANVETGRDALIQAPNGSTILVAGQKIEMTGRGLEGIRLQVQAPADSAVNLGTLSGDAVGMFAGTLRHSGAIQANAVSTEGGKVVLKATEVTRVDGTVQASALGQKGGTIMATARQVQIDGTAVLDASGALGGGEVLVGGGYQGRDARLSNAQTTLVSAGAQLKADATQQGNGGTVVVWADGATRYEGSLSARGGALGGNGGTAEVSGKGYLDFNGMVDLSSPTGKKGDLLLDPLNIVVSNTRTADIDGSGSGSGADIATGGDLSLSSSFGSVTSQITATQISALLVNADVTLAASNDITLKDSIYTAGSITATTLKLDAGHDIIFDSNSIFSPMDFGSYSNALNINLIAGNSIRTVGYGANIYSQGGRIDLKAGAGGINGVITGINLLNLYSDGAAKVGGNVQINSDGIVAINTIFAAGYGGAETGSRGYNGGVVNVDAVGAITIDTINAKGRDADSFSQTSLSGGSGGSVSVVGGYGTDVNTIDVGAGSGTGGGSSGSGGSIAFTLNSGDIDYGTTVVGASSVTLKALAGTITQSNAITANALTTQSSGDTLLTASNVVGNFNATITGSGNLDFVGHSAGAPADLNITGITVNTGNVNIVNYGATSTSGKVSAGGTVGLEARSPLTIGDGGVVAGGGISLTASTDLTLNGLIKSTGGGVTMAATGGNLLQNSGVLAAGRIGATAGGAISFGFNGYSSGNPLDYSDASGPVSVPRVPLSVTTANILGDPSVSPLDEFLAALDEQAFTDDPFDPRNREQDALVVEGQICTP